MIFNWEDGYQKEFKPLSKVVGLTHNTKRPDTVTLSYDDFSKILKHKYGVKYLVHLQTRLKYNGN